MTDFYDIAETLAAALPPQGGPCCTIARNAWVNRIKGATPGRYSGWPVAGASFRQIFFPSYEMVPLQNQVSSITGLGNDWWSGLAVVVLCQTMYQQTSNLRGQLLKQKINAEINSHNTTLRGKSSSWYGHVVAQRFQPFLDAVAAAPSQTLAETYCRGLRSDAWVLAKTEQYVDGNWPNIDWELFNHWIKLNQLGLSISDIDCLIHELKNKGLPVPANVDVGSWPTYMGWSSPAAISWKDFGEAIGPILKEKCQVYPGAMFPSCMKEHNSFEFTANTQPGSPYRQPPGASCFHGATRVLMADAITKTISEVAIGDMVATPSGSARVVVVARPPRAGRTLFSIDGIDVRFTRTHPLVTVGGSGRSHPPQLASMAPLDTIGAVPTLGQLGMAPIEVGVLLAGRGADGTRTPLMVTRIDSHPPNDDDGDELLYDVVVEVPKTAVSEYFVGDGSTWFVAASEVPRADVEPEVGHVLETMMLVGWPVISTALEPLDDQQFDATLYATLLRLMPTLVPDALQQIQRGSAFSAGTPNGAAAARAAPHELANRMAASFVITGADGQPTNDSRRGRCFEMLVQLFANELAAAIRMGWRLFPGQPSSRSGILAVSALDLQLVGAAPRFSADAVDIFLTLQAGHENEAKIVQSRVEGTTVGYYYEFLKPAYFSIWRSAEVSEGYRPWEITARFMAHGGAELLPIVGQLALPDTIDNGFRRMSMLITTIDGEPCGELALDARPLTVNQLSSENASCRRWRPDDSLMLADKLALICASLLAERFPVVACQLLTSPTAE
ncbi:MAG: hypothetical protein HC927_01005 [Deltaproteobacteria bacterium]|nr:hypothetical protein [Deltaproteobacteria bacterium]